MSSRCRRLRESIGILCTAALASACVGRIDVPFDPNASRAHAPAEHGEAFSYTPGPMAPVVHELPALETRFHQALSLSWPSVGDNPQPGDRVTATYFRSKRPGVHRLVIVLPLWGGHAYPPRTIAEGLRDRSRGDTHVLRLLGMNYLFDWDELAASPDAATFRERARQMNERMRTEVIDIRRLIDWAQSQSEIDAGRIGLVGFSMSAVIGGMVVGSDARLRAAVLVMGGANLHEIVSTCDGPLQRVRETVKSRLTWSQSRYLAETDAIFAPLNPSNFASRTPASRVLMFDSLYDECMPRSARDAFWETLGRPRRITMRYGHKGSFLAMTPLGLNSMRRQIYRFIEAEL